MRSKSASCRIARYGIHSDVDGKTSDDAQNFKLFFSADFDRLVA